jgi:hypothetical protein
MADPPGTPAQGPPPPPLVADLRRQAPPAFVPPAAGRISSPPPPPVTPSPPPPVQTFQSSSSRFNQINQNGGEKHGGDAFLTAMFQADSDYSADGTPGPAQTEESSNQNHSNGSKEQQQKWDAEQRSDGKSHSSHHGLSNGVGSNTNAPPFPVPGSAVPAVPMGPVPMGQPPPHPTFSQPPHFASPVRPIPSFNAVPSPGRGSSFSEIPLLPGTPPTLPGSANYGAGDQPLYPADPEEEFDASSSPASTSYVLFSAQTVDIFPFHCSFIVIVSSDYN